MSRTDTLRSSSKQVPIKIGEHISHNFFRVSDAVAGQLARDAMVPLPAHGHQLNVALPGGQLVWLIRTPTHYIPGYPKRGWVWAVYSNERIRA